MPIFNALTSKIINFSLINVNNLLNTYNLESKYINNLNEKILQINLGKSKYYLKFDITAQHKLAITSIKNNTKPNLTLFITSSLLFSNKENLLSNVKIEGDAHLASNLIKLLQSLNLTLEDILSLKLPPITSYLLSEFIKKISINIKYSAHSLLTHTSEYFVYENKNLISKIEFQIFEQEIYELRDNVDRIEQKLNKLNKILQ